MKKPVLSLILMLVLALTPLMGVQAAAPAASVTPEVVCKPGARVQLGVTQGDAIAWRVGNQTIATVDSRGNVTCKSAGNTYVYAIRRDGSSTRCLLRVKDGATTTAQLPSEAKVQTGDCVSVAPTVQPLKSALGEVTYRVGNPSVAKVDANGLVTGLKNANTYVYACNSAGEVISRLLLRVCENANQPSLKLAPLNKTLTVGESADLSLSGATSGAKVTWRVGNTRVATVNAAGKVTAVGAGNTYVYATSQGCTVRTIVRVVAAKPTPTVAPTATPAPTVAPTATPAPTAAPTATPRPTVAPTPRPTVAPTATPRPTVAPTATPRPTVAPTPAPTTNPGTGTTESQMAQEMLRMVNEERAKAGLAALTMDNSALVQAANVRAKESQQSFSHTRPNGTSCFTALSEAGVSYRTAGENIAYNSYSNPVQQAMTGLMNSDGHRANILSANFTKIGIGVYRLNGLTYFAQMFIG